MNERAIEEIATEFLRSVAKENNTTLYKMGIIDTRRRHSINKREIYMSRIKSRSF